MYDDQTQVACTRQSSSGLQPWIIDSLQPSMLHSLPPIMLCLQFSTLFPHFAGITRKTQSSRSWKFSCWSQISPYDRRVKSGINTETGATTVWWNLGLTRKLPTPAISYISLIFRLIPRSANYENNTGTSPYCGFLLHSGAAFFPYYFHSLYYGRSENCENNIENTWRWHILAY